MQESLKNKLREEWNMTGGKYVSDLLGIKANDEIFNFFISRLDSILADKKSKLKEIREEILIGEIS